MVEHITVGCVSLYPFDMSHVEDGFVVEVNDSNVIIWQTECSADMPLIMPNPNPTTAAYERLFAIWTRQSIDWYQQAFVADPEPVAQPMPTYGM